MNQVMKIKIINNIPNMQIFVDKNKENEIVLDLTQEEGVLLGNVPCGDTVKLGNRECIVLDHNDGTTAVITKQFVKTMAFGENGNYLTSDIRSYCIGDFYQELAKVVGAENIVPHVVNLDADDGTGDHVECTDSVSILTRDQYRRYRKFLPAYDEWWWLATRVNTDDPDYARYVCCVNPSGILSWGGYVCRGGVRPFCILNSSILVS